jgi:hypothetical protein
MTSRNGRSLVILTRILSAANPFVDTTVIAVNAIAAIIVFIGFIDYPPLFVN